MLPVRPNSQSQNIKPYATNKTESNPRQDHAHLCHNPLCFLLLRETDTYFCIYPKIGHTLPSPADSLLLGSAVSMEEN